MHPTMPKAKTLGGRHIKYINLLSKIATDIVNPVGGNARLAACIVYKNDVVAFGVNQMKSHPFQARYSKNSDSVFLHAETSAIKNALRFITIDELEKSTLYICRVKHHGQSLGFGMSKPCPGCFRCINAFNIPKVIYTLDNGTYDVL